MTKIKIAILLLMLSVTTFCSDNKKDEVIYIASWNVENLFDTVDNNLKNDDDFTPEGRLNWTNEKLDTKYKNLAKVFNYMNKGKGPDILAVQEVEHEYLLKELISNYLNDNKYKIVYAESPDNRGIDNGIIFNSELFEFIEMDTLRVNLESGYPTRFILYANLKHIYGNSVHIFSNHWPSRRGGLEKSEPNRKMAASVLKDFIQMKNLQNENIVIMGDFNDDPNNKSVFEVLGAKDYKCVYNDESVPQFVNTAFKEFEKGIGTYLYRGNWNMLDQIIISKSFYNDQDFKYICGSFEVIKPDFMVKKDEPYKDSSIRTFGGGNYIGGYSDHYPVGAKIIFQK